MIITHDPKHGLSYIYLTGPIARGGVKRTKSCGPDINLDFDAGGALVGIELLGARLLHPALMATTVPPGRGDG